MSNSLIDYNRILLKIESLIVELDDAMDYSGAAIYRNKASQLTAWLNDGRQGTCPIDLSEFGVGVVSPAMLEASVESKEKITPQEDKEVASLTPEERNIQEKIKEIREHIDMGRLRQAVALAGAVESRATGDAKDRAAQLLEEARQKRGHAVSLTNKKGDEILKSGDKEKAHRYYEKTLDLDPDNEYAKSRLRQMDSNTLSEELSSQKATELRGGLRDLKNIKRLGVAVYEAESLDAEGRLSNDLQKLLQEAREKYNQIRTAQGDETTMMRFGDLAARKEARDRIANRLAQGETFIFDITTDHEKPAFDMMREADGLLEHQSADTAQYELDVINGLLPAHPGGARSRLENALSKPFHEHHRRDLEKKLEDINQLLEQQKGAEAFLVQATAQEDAVKAFGLILKAQGTFAYLPGMEVEISQARDKAIAFVARKMEDAFAQARGLLGEVESVEARQMVGEAMRLFDVWPQSEKPQQLHALVKQGKLLLEFDAQALQIRKEAEDPKRMEAALKKLEEMRKDERFAALPEMRTFISELDQYRNAVEQLREVRRARVHGDWKRVFDLMIKIKDGDYFGNLAGQVEMLYAEAEQEVRIEDVRTLLDNLEIKKANSILSQILATEKDPQRKAILEKRLETEIQVIAAAIQNTPIAQPAYDRAVALRNGQEEERLEALQIFRYLGGIVMEKPYPELPEYAFTLRTPDARKNAVDVASDLRVKCLETIQKAYGEHDGNWKEVDTLHNLARFARILREGNLIYCADENAAVRWAEVQWAKYQAKIKGDDFAISIWSKIDKFYPCSEEITKNLQLARIGKITTKLGRLLTVKQDVRPIITELENAIIEYGETVSLLCLLSEAHARLGNQEEAARILRKASSIKDANDSANGWGTIAKGDVNT